MVFYFRNGQKETLFFHLTLDSQKNNEQTQGGTPMAKAVIDAEAGKAIVILNDGKRYKIEPGIETPTQIDEYFNHHMFFGGGSSPINEQELTEPWPFEVLNRELKASAEIATVYCGLRFIIDPDVSIQTRRGILADYETRLHDPAVKDFTMAKMRGLQQRGTHSAEDFVFDVISVHGRAYELFQAIRAFWSTNQPAEEAT